MQRFIKKPEAASGESEDTIRELKDAFAGHADAVFGHEAGSRKVEAVAG